MRKLLLVAIMLYTAAGAAQTITDKHGDVFDIRDVESGTYVEYVVTIQGIFIWKEIVVDFERATKITKKSW